VHQWCAPRAADFLIRCWNADGVLYDMVSGDTHRLGALHLELMDLIISEPRTLENLRSVLEPDLPDDLTPADQRQLILRGLEDLQAMGLLEAPVP